MRNFISITVAKAYYGIPIESTVCVQAVVNQDSLMANETQNNSNDNEMKRKKEYSPQTQ